ncbi:MAG: hypothetical protein HYU97_04850 [Deltaproteobacteria bacterium]|nr:hypothetical protein [Deltaproteobacteria bacterium]
MNYLLKQLMEYGTTEYQQYQPGLGRMREMLKRLGYPKRGIEFILVGGTNGKGSVARILHGLLWAQGLQVGLYTSPHLVRFNERIVVGNREVTNATLEKVLRYFQKKKITGRPTFFELTTLLALEVFRRARVKIAILEVGLGGRFDATNVVDPGLSVLVSVGHDHQEILGRGLEKIALEKIGIFRPGKLALVGKVPGHVKRLIQDKAKQSKLCFLPKIESNFLESGRDSLNPSKGVSSSLFPLLKSYFPNSHIQRHNLALALRALWFWQRGKYFPAQNILEEALRRIELPGRMEVRGNIVLDGAHNLEAAQALVKFLKKLSLRPRTLIRGKQSQTERLLRHKAPRNDKYIFLVGMATSKDRKKFINVIRPLAKKIIFTEFLHPRAVKLETWRREFKIRGAEYFRHPKSAYQRLLNCRGKNIGVVTGSFYLVGILRSRTEIR